MLWKIPKYDLTGVLLDVIALANMANNRFIQIRGGRYERNKCGGIWATNLNNWDKWQEIDSAIWHLLDSWNAAP